MNVAAFLAKMADSNVTGSGQQILDAKAVPTADATTNAYERDAVGNKTDAAVTTVGTTKSLMAYIKGLLGLHPVPTADATTNTNMRDVVGNKTDAAVSTATTTKSLMAYIKGILALLLVPTADATTNATINDVVGNKTDAAVNAVAVNKSLMGYLKALIAGSHTAAGTTFWVQKSLTSSAVVQAGVDITGASSGGDLEIEQIIVRTDGTGLATGTNFVVKSDNALGLANILVEAVANLGANKTVNLGDASVTKVPTILTSTKKLIAASTVADCTGGGVVHLSIKFRRLVAGATVAAA